MARTATESPVGLVSCDAAGAIKYDPRFEPLADGGIVRQISPAELIPAPEGIVKMLLPRRAPLTTIGPLAERTAMAVALPAGYTRLLLPSYAAARDAPPLPLFGYTFACVVDDRLHVAAMRTDEDEDWEPRSFRSRRTGGDDRAPSLERAAESRPRASRAVLARIRLLYRAERVLRAW